jgi:hypothetical protein
MANFFAPKEPPRKAIVAAAHTVNLDSPEDARKTIGRSEGWQDTVLGLYDDVGQMKHAAWLIGDVLSNVHIYVGEVQTDPKDSPVPTENNDAKAPLERLRNNSEGVPTLLREHAMHGVTVGECYLVGLSPRDSQGNPDPDGKERWFIASIKEVSGSDPVKVKDPDDPLKEVELLSPRKAEERGAQPDFVARMWQRHIANGTKADSPYRGIITDAKEYVLFGKTMRAVALTRMTNAGFMKVPYELSFDPVEGMPEDMDPFMQVVVQATKATLQSEGSANSAIPIVVRGAAEHLAAFEHVLIDRPLDRLWMELREKSLEHISQGLPLPPEFTFGLGKANHWSAGSIEESAFRQYFEPLLVWICNCWTRAFLWPSYEAQSFDSADKKYVVWFDASAMVTDSEKAKNAGEAHDRELISDDTYLEALGFTTDDKPSEEEIALRREAKRAKNPIPPPQEPATTLPEEPVTASVQVDIGAELVRIDRGLQERLEGAAEIAMEQVLERAGNRLRSRSQRDKTLLASLSGVKPKAIAATIGRTKVASLASADELLADAWVELEDRFERWIASAQDQVLGMIPGMSDIEKREAQSEQARHRMDAWKWLSTELDARAVETLYSPSQGGSLTQLVREALGRAGGG